MGFPARFQLIVLDHDVAGEDEAVPALAPTSVHVDEGV